MCPIDVAFQRLFDGVAKDETAAGPHINKFEALEAYFGIANDQIFQAYISVQNRSLMQKLHCLDHFENAHFCVDFFHLA